MEKLKYRIIARLARILKCEYLIDWEEYNDAIKPKKPYTLKKYRP